MCGVVILITRVLCTLHRVLCVIKLFYILIQSDAKPRVFSHTSASAARASGVVRREDPREGKIILPVPLLYDMSYVKHGGGERERTGD